MSQSVRQEALPGRTAERWLLAIAQLAAGTGEEVALSWDEEQGMSPRAWASERGVSADLQAKALARALEIPYVENLAERAPSSEFVERFPIGFARKHGLLGLAGEQDCLAVAVAGIGSWSELDVVARHMGRRVEPLLAPADQIQAAINRAYQERTGQAQTLIDSFDSLDRKDVLEELERLESREDLLDVSDRAPVIKLVNLVLFEAVKGRASDVHIQPYEDRMVVRFRIDGVLFDAFKVPKELQEEVISRIKVHGKMNIAEKRLPQDGRATVQVGDRLIDLRIASLPTSHGERVVIRLLDKSARLYTLSEIGMDEETLEQFRELIHLEHGLILVTGPTGSGKSTTLYGALQEINTKDSNVVTLEDPIEYQLDGVSQSQINEKKGMTFARGLRNVLRQDPDIIMVGEIRDQETAVMAIQSALTGHLVFSTLHTNDAASAITRLLDLGIESYLLSSSLIAVLAQRLVRRVCQRCAEGRPPTPGELEQLGISEGDPGQVWHGRGCSACRETGYSGRKGIFELLVVDEGIRAKIQGHANAAQIRDVAIAGGMRLLRHDGVLKVFSGVTDVEEVVRVTTRTTL